MKTPSDDLFRLVQQMTKEERRFFRHISRNLRTGEEVQELQLFDAMDGAEAYDEEGLKRKFADVWNDNQFAVAKNQLYNNILRALVFVTHDRGYRRRVRLLLQQVEILYHRELYDQCRKLLDRASKLADQSQHPELQLEVADWRMRVWTILYFKDIDLKDFNEVNNTIVTCADKLQRLAQYHEQINIMVYRYRTSSVLQTRQEFISGHADRLKTVLFSQESLADSNPARILYHYGHGFYHFLAGDIALSFGHYNQIMLLLESMPENVHDFYNFYLPIIYGHAILGLRSGNYDAAWQSIQKIEQLQVEHASQKMKNYYFGYVLKIEYYFATSHMAELKALMEEGEKKLPQLEKHLSSQEHLIFLINSCVAQYVSGNPKMALRWLNKVLQFPQIASYQDYLFITMVMQILFNFELRNDDVMPSLIRSLQRWMEKRERPFRTEHLFVEFIDKVMASPSSRATLDLCIEYRTRFIELTESPEERTTFRYFDFVSWLDAQIEGTTYAEVLRRKAVVSE